MKLNEIANNPGAHKRKLKVGRGSSLGARQDLGPWREGREGAYRHEGLWL